MHLAPLDGTPDGQAQAERTLAFRRRIVKMEVLPQMVGVVVEYGRAKKSECTREEITLRRNRQGELVFVNRVGL